MEEYLGLRARRAVAVGGALTILATVLSGSVFAQTDGPPPPAESAAPDASVAPAASPAPQPPRPARFRPAAVPRAGIGVSVHDVIPGGPGYLAVGGGSQTGLDLKAHVWASEDGLSWQSVPLFGDAADGLMSAIAPLRGGGYVAVGHEFSPDPDAAPEAAPVNALAWRSDQGLLWERVPPDDSFTGSLISDATSTPDGVVAAGCRAGFHCEAGRFWRTSDGITWQLLAEVATVPYAIAATADALVAGGTDDAASLNGGQAIMSRSVDGVSWEPAVPVGGGSSQVLDVIATDGAGALAIGIQQPDGDGMVESVLFSSADGESWDVIERQRFEGMVGSGLAGSGDLVLMLGSRGAGETPAIMWSDDLEAFRAGRFAAGSAGNATDILGGAVAEDGTMVLAYGARDFRPAIWVSRIR